MSSPPSSQPVHPAPEPRSVDGDLRRLLAAVNDMREGMRRENGETRPLGKKALRTRTALLESAYDCFTTHGYRATSVQQIHEAAGVSLGTFYQYFHDKAEVIATLVAEAIAQSAGDLFPPLELTAGGGGVGHVVDRFVRNYASSADFQQVWEEVTHIEEVAARFRWDVSSILDRSLQSSIEAGQASGTVAPELDPLATAQALGAMVDRYCYRRFVVERRRDAESVDHAVTVLTDLWERALGIT